MVGVCFERLKRDMESATFISSSVDTSINNQQWLSMQSEVAYMNNVEVANLEN